MHLGCKKAVLKWGFCLILVIYILTSHAWSYDIAPLYDWSLNSLKQQAQERVKNGAIGVALLVSSGYLFKVMREDLNEMRGFSATCSIAGGVIGAGMVVDALIPTTLKDIVKVCYLSSEDRKLSYLSWEEFYKWDNAFPRDPLDPIQNEKYKKRRSEVLKFVADKVTDGELEALLDLLRFVNSTPEELERFYQYTANKNPSSLRSEFMQEQRALIKDIKAQLTMAHTHQERSEVYKLLYAWNEARSYCKNQVSQNMPTR